MRLPKVDSPLVPGDVSLRSSPNWSAVLFFASLAFLHYCFATWSLSNGRWEAYLSLVMGTMFLTLCVGCYRWENVLTVRTRKRLVCLRSGLGRWSILRHVRFADVLAVRFTQLSGCKGDDVRIELLCRDHQDMDCPLTDTPRQQALYLSIAMGVPLQRVTNDEAEAGLKPELLNPVATERIRYNSH